MTDARDRYGIKMGQKLHLHLFFNISERQMLRLLVPRGFGLRIVLRLSAYHDQRF